MHFHVMVKQKVHGGHMQSQWLNDKNNIHYHFNTCKNQDLYKAAKHSKFTQ